MTTTNTKLEGILEGVTKTLDKIEKSLYGNGQPGLVERITRIEENLNSLSENMETNNDNMTEKIAGLVEAVESLNKTTNAHINDVNLHTPKGLLLRKDVLPYLVGGMILIASILPEEVSLFELVKKLIGL